MTHLHFHTRTAVHGVKLGEETSGWGDGRSPPSIGILSESGGTSTIGGDVSYADGGFGLAG